MCDMLAWSIVVVLALLLILFFFLDVHYFYRSVLTIVWAKFFRKRIGLLEESEIYGMVLPMDADLLVTHMNNARAFREFDFCRYDHSQRTGILKLLFKNKATGLVSAETCRFRKPLDMFMLYKIVTKPVYYDSKHVYFEHRVITLHDKMIRCIAYVKLAFTLDLGKLMAENYPEVKQPEPPKDLQHWMDYIRVNSEALMVHRVDSGNGVGNSGKSNGVHSNGTEDLIKFKSDL